MRYNGLFDVESKKLSKKGVKILEIIKENWPTNPLEVAKKLSEQGNVKQLSARMLYHFRRLQKAGHIHLKKIGNTFVAWPADIEKLRIIHELVKE